MSCLRVIGQFVSEFARLILFIASIIFLLSSSLLLMFAFQSRRDFSFVQMENINTVLAVVLGLSAYLIALALIGVCASFFSNKGTIKLLALVTVLNVAVGIAVLASSSPKMDSVHADLQVKLRNLQAKYDWTHVESRDEETRNATLAWDRIQSDLQCCGLEGPADWDKYKPKGHSSDHILPASCCQSYAKDHHGDKQQAAAASGSAFCHPDKASIWTKGCTDEMQSTFALIMDMVIFVVSFSLVVGFLAGLVLCCRPAEVTVRPYTHYR